MHGIPERKLDLNLRQGAERGAARETVLRPVVRTITGQSDLTLLRLLGQFVLASSDDGSLLVLDGGLRVIGTVAHGAGVWAFDAVYAGAKLTVVSGGIDRQIKFTEFAVKGGSIAATRLSTQCQHRSTIRALCCGSEVAAAGSRDATISLFDLSGFLLHRFLGHSASVRVLLLHRNLLLSGSYDGSVRVWDTVRLRPVAVVATPLDRVYALLLLPLPSGNAILVSAGLGQLIVVTTVTLRQRIHHKSVRRLLDVAATRSATVSCPGRAPSLIPWLYHCRGLVLALSVSGDLVEYDPTGRKPTRTISLNKQVKCATVVDGTLLVGTTDGMHLIGEMDQNRLMLSGREIKQIDGVGDRVVVGYYDEMRNVVVEVYEVG